MKVRKGCGLNGDTEKPGFKNSALPRMRTPGAASGHNAVRSILGSDG